MKHPIKCSCGRLRGEILNRRSGVRAVCYCKDCQVFAAFLQKSGDVLDESGGTEVIGLRSSNLRFTEGVEHLRCMSLSPNGLLRWYADCCNTPIGNTPRNYKVSHLGLIHSVVDGAPQSLGQAFGPLRLRVNTGSAKNPIAQPRIGTRLLIQHFASLAKQRLTGRYKKTPFFTVAGEAVVEPLVLTLEKRRELEDAV